MAALLPPSSSSARPKRAATRGPTCWPIRTEPVADSSAIRGSSTSRSPSSRPPRIRPLTAGGAPTSAAARLDQRLAGQGRQRGQLRRLPHHRVPAHQRYRGVPCPHRHREVERGDHARPHRADARSRPADARALGGDGAAVELARQADGELADVDHLLHFAQRLGGDLADLDRHQRGQVVLVLGEQLAEPGHQRAAHRGRGAPPRRKRFGGIGDRLFGLLGGGLRDGEQHLAGDRGAGRQAVPARLVEAASAFTPIASNAPTRPGAQLVGLWSLRLPPGRALRRARRGRECGGRSPRPANRAS